MEKNIEMEKKGIVSLWLGSIASENDLNELLKINYSEDGDLIPSEFAKAFSITRYNDATREAEFLETSQESLERILEGFSYDDFIVPKFKKYSIVHDISKYNCVILLYDFEYDQEIKSTKRDDYYFEFIGSTNYEHVNFVFPNRKCKLNKE